MQTSPTSSQTYYTPLLLPVHRYFHTSTLYKHFIITYGGGLRNHEDNDLKREIEVYNIRRKLWEVFELTGDIPEYRQGHSACLFDTNKILIFGGIHVDPLKKNLPNQTALITIHETNHLTLEYKIIKTTGEENLQRFDHSANIYKNKMFVFGGRNANSLHCTNELWALDLETFIWKQCQSSGIQPEPKAMHLSAIYQNKLYVFGGYSDKNHSSNDACHVLSLATMKWENLNASGEKFHARCGGSSQVYQNKIFFVGHEKGVLAYDFDENVFSKHPAGKTSDTLFASTVLCRDTLIILSINKIHQIKLTLTEDCQGAQDSFSKHFQSLLFSSQFSDITFSVENEQIPAHKVILASRCGMKESNLAVIEIPDTNIDTFKALLEFLYENKVELTVKLALNLYQLADKYMQGELVKLCEGFLCRNLKLENLASTIELAEKFEVERLRENILIFIIQNHQKIGENSRQYKIPDFYLWEALSLMSKNCKA